MVSVIYAECRNYAYYSLCGYAGYCGTQHNYTQHQNPRCLIQGFDTKTIDVYKKNFDTKTIDIYKKNYIPKL
jgi:hypothetical protein